MGRPVPRQAFLKQHWKGLLLIILLGLGLFLSLADHIPWQQLLITARAYSEHWWLALLFVLYQIVLFMFALPGTSTVWLVAPIYPPASATLILTAGQTLGAIAAYHFSQQLGSKWRGRIVQQPLFQTLQSRGDLLTLFALRILPGFPHSVINYASGILQLPRLQFIITTLVGTMIKNFIYCQAIFETMQRLEQHASLDMETLLPLILLALLLLFARLIMLFLQRYNRAH